MCGRCCVGGGGIGLSEGYDLRLDQSLPRRVSSRMPTGAGHQPIAVVFDLVNPVRARRWFVGARWEAGFNEARRG